jgi:hypothetical protein
MEFYFGWPTKIYRTRFSLHPFIQRANQHTQVTFVFDGIRTILRKVKTRDTDTTLASLSAAAGFKTELVQDKATVSYKQYPIGIILMHFWKGS